jgi:trigger factor
MKINVNVVSPVQRKIEVELPPEAVREEFARVYGNLVKKAKIRGFRPGKVPRPVLEGIYGEEVRGEVRSRLVESSLQELFREQKIPVVSQPRVEAQDLQEGQAFAFSALVEVKPEIEVKDYLGLDLEKVKLALRDADVDKALNHLQNTHAHLEPVEDNRDSAEKGDFVLIDFTGSVDGKPFPEGKVENYLLELGAGQALPQFEEALIGLQKQTEHAIHVAYPGDYYKPELAGKTALFSVTIREIKRKILPPLDDEFAKDYGECATLEELKQKIRGRLQSQLDEMQNQELKEQILSRLIDRHSFEVPPALVEEQVRYLEQRSRSREAAAQTPAENAAADRKSREQQAERQVRAMLLLEKIGEREKVEASDEDVQHRVDDMARAAKERAAAVRKAYSQPSAREDLRSRMIFDRTLQFLLEHARITEVDSSLMVDEVDKKS